MTVFISINNWKGGVGKSTTAVHLAAGLAIRGKKVLLMDFDVQGDATYHLLPKGTKIKHTVTSIFDGDTLAESIYKSVIPGLDIVPGDLSAISLRLETESDERRNTLLKKAVNKKTAAAYDYVIIDVPPAFGIYMFNALSISDKVIIPVNEFLGMRNLSKYIRVVKSFAKEYNPELKIDSIVRTMVMQNAKEFKDIKGVLEKRYGDMVCKTCVPRAIKFSETPSYNNVVYNYAPGSYCAKQHMKLVDELLNKWEGAA